MPNTWFEIKYPQSPTFHRNVYLAGVPVWKTSLHRDLRSCMAKKHRKYVAGNVLYNSFIIGDHYQTRGDRAK